MRTPLFRHGDAGKQVELCPGKTENIIVVGSEQYYDPFWLKMMFIAPGFGIAAGTTPPPGWPSADRTTILYVPFGYVSHELLALEWLRDNLGVNLVPIRSTGALIGYINNRMIEGEEHLINALLWMAHGLHNRTELNFYDRKKIRVFQADIQKMKPEAFCSFGKLYSYACRTGISVSYDHFGSLEAAQPENSLAQVMADHLRLPALAFYTRTLFRHCIRDPNDSESISENMKQNREGKSGQVVPIDEEYEGLPHPGQGTTSFASVGVDIPLVSSGQEDEGTSEYSLWRKAGGRSLPISAESPTGLPSGYNWFLPR